MTMQAVQHNLTSHHNFHPHEHVGHDHLTRKGETKPAAQEAHESLVGHGYEKLSTHTERHKGAPKRHVYRHKHNGHWAVVTEHPTEQKTTVAFKRSPGQAIRRLTLASTHHRAQFPMHKGHGAGTTAGPSAHAKEFLEHPEVKKFGGAVQQTSGPHLTHVKSGEHSLHHTHSGGQHHVTIIHHGPSGVVKKGEGSHHNLGVALVHANKNLNK